MLKKLIKNYSKKIIAKACQALPPRGKRVTKKAALCVLNSMAMQTERGASGTRLSIAVFLCGGLGDSLISLAWIKEVHRNMSELIDFDIYGRTDFLSSITLLHPYIANVFDYRLYDCVSGYDVKLQIAHFIKLDFVDIRRVHDKSHSLEKLLLSITTFNKAFLKYVDHQPDFDGAWAAYCILRGWDRWRELNVNSNLNFSQETMLGLHLNINKLSVLEKYGLKDKCYITIHAGCDSAHADPTQCTKIWPREKWAEFCLSFKKIHPEITIVQIGGNSGFAINESDLLLCGKTDLMESFVVLKYSQVHVDGESGLVHVRHQLGGESVVMFGPTPEEYFGYKNNTNIVSSVCNKCLWMTEQWSNICPNGFSRPECMHSIRAKDVVEAVDRIIKSKKKYKYSLQDVDIYSSAGRNSFIELIDDMCERCVLEKTDISEHIFGPVRTYIHASKQWEYPYVINVINKITANKPLQIADVGGGRGMLAWYLAEIGHHVSVFDINYRWDDGGDVDIENKFFKFAKENSFNADYGSVFNIPANDETFDVVTCVSVVEHIPFKSFAIKELLRVLKPGGKLILTYDLVVSNPVGRDSLRVEIFTPESIRYELELLGIEVQDIHPKDIIATSLSNVVSDRVNIASDMTVGAFVLNKEVIEP